MSKEIARRIVLDLSSKLYTLRKNRQVEGLTEDAVNVINKEIERLQIKLDHTFYVTRKMGIILEQWEGQLMTVEDSN